jgi:hypothetical protein
MGIRDASSRWMWVSALGVSACANVEHRTDASSSPDAVRVNDWTRCCPADGNLPGVMTRGSGDSLQCLCPVGEICNFGLCFRTDAAQVMEAGVMEAGATEDAGFADAGPMDDAALDALITDAGDAIDGASVITDDASL